MSDFRRARTNLQRLAATTAVLYLFGHLAVFAHTLAVQHVSCPEHGETIHLSTDAPLTFAESDTESPDQFRGSSPADVHGDDHCSLISLVPSHHFHVASGSLMSEREVAPHDDVEIPALSPRPPPIAVLHLAPKQSPPGSVVI